MRQIRQLQILEALVATGVVPWLCWVVNPLFMFFTTLICNSVIFMSTCVRIKECKTFWIYKNKWITFTLQKDLLQGSFTQHAPLAPWKCTIADKALIHYTSGALSKEVHSKTKATLGVRYPNAAISVWSPRSLACLPSKSTSERHPTLWKASWVLTEPSVGCASNVISIGADRAIPGVKDIMGKLKGTTTTYHLSPSYGSEPRRNVF